MKQAALSLFLVLFIISVPLCQAEEKIDLNAASLQELVKVPGIGEKTGLNIIEHRQKIGKFSRYEQLMEVKGIGPATYNKIVGYFTIPGAPAATTQSTEPAPTGPAKPSSGRKININTASTSELVQLPGIGIKTAEKIVAFREENGPFKTIEDIIKVKGIGPAKFAKISEMISVK